MFLFTLLTLIFLNPVAISYAQTLEMIFSHLNLYHNLKMFLLIIFQLKHLLKLFLNLQMKCILYGYSQINYKVIYIYLGKI
jgi:hypothetical protein